MAVRSFLSTISPVIAREPAVFVEALANTCNVEEATGSMGTGRPIVVLKPKVCTLLLTACGMHAQPIWWPVLVETAAMLYLAPTAPWVRYWFV